MIESNNIHNNCRPTLRRNSTSNELSDKIIRPQSGIRVCNVVEKGRSEVTAPEYETSVIGNRLNSVDARSNIEGVCFVYGTTNENVVPEGIRKKLQKNVSKPKIFYGISDYGYYIDTETNKMIEMDFTIQIINEKYILDSNAKQTISVQCRYPKYILYVACAGAAVGAFGLFIRLYK